VTMVTMEDPRFETRNQTLRWRPPEPVRRQVSTTGLTPLELEVLCYLAAGETDQAIADTLFLSRRTVTTQVASILAKLGVRTRTAAATQAMRTGLV
jgi:DNA-binding NarL/FixJ family response regulator